MGRNIILWFHKWLGLLTGLVVFLVSLSGCIYVFTDELKNWMYRERTYVLPADRPLQPLSILKQNAEQALGNGFPISRADIYSAPDRSWVFRAIDLNPEGLTHWDYYPYYYRVYLNPYTGQVLHVEDSRNEFFQLVLGMHMRLLLGQKYGHPLVAYSVLIFVVLLLSGLFIWWPRQWTRAARQGNFRIKFKASFKRLNYDLHNVLGFYTLLPALALALTGLVFSFDWVDQSFYRLVMGGQQPVKKEKLRSVAVERPVAQPLDRAFQQAWNANRDADLFSVRFPEKSDGVLDITARLKPSRTFLFRRAYYNQHDGTLLRQEQTDLLNRGEKLRAINFDVHTGSVLNLPGKVLAFVASLICTSLPVTGFLIFWNRRKKGKRNRIAQTQLQGHTNL
ncbi:PepSY-associated TM helix domain-containing protein [Larkinella harenae]